MTENLDAQATACLQRLHAELVSHNRRRVGPAGRCAVNHFMAGLIRGFFAERLNLPPATGAGFPGWADEPPCLSREAHSYIDQAARLDWTRISPTIFGAMVQTAADHEERATLGLHYTSAPNILKVLEPLFLENLRNDLEAAGRDTGRLIQLRARLAHIRIFDPACGAGNFLIVAYQALRALEVDINQRLGETGRRSDLHIGNFRGIELLEFPGRIAQLALSIAARQCDIAQGCAESAALDAKVLHGSPGSITHGNALDLDWLDICAGPAGGEIYICGNPPFTGTRKQTDAQKGDLQAVLSPFTDKWKNADYAGAWLVKAALLNRQVKAPFAFVITNSLCQGQQVPITWAILKELGCHIRFAHTSFIWEGQGKTRVGVTVVIVGLDQETGGPRHLYSHGGRRAVEHINAYLTTHRVDIVAPARCPLFSGVAMDYGVYYSKSSGLLLSPREKEDLLGQGFPPKLIRRFLGSIEFINGIERYCLWLDDTDLQRALEFPAVRERIESVRRDRLSSRDFWVNRLAVKPHQFREFKGDENFKIFIPIVSSINRHYLPVGVANETIIPTNKAFYIPNAPLWCLSVLASRMHLIWISAVCGHLRSDYSYSNTLGWNTFPLPALTDIDKIRLTECAQNILDARHQYPAATLADLYDMGHMPEPLRQAHERNDESLERLYANRRFNGDGERLQTLFDLYARRMAARSAAA